jgi:hypothetical protein
MEWNNPVKEGQRLTFFHLLAQIPANLAGALNCTRLTENSCAMALPAPAIAGIGEFHGIRAEAAVLATDHFYARRLLACAPGTELLTVSDAVDVDWDFPRGILHVAAAKPTTIALLHGPDAEPPRLNGQAIRNAAGKRAPLEVSLPPGRHCITGVRPAPQALRDLARLLAKLNTESARQEVAGQAEHMRVRPPTAAKELRTVFTTPVAPKAISDVLELPEDAEARFAVVTGSEVVLLSTEGAETGRFAADARIRVARWWPEASLLLAGCVDEKVIAFDRDGTRRWEFVSEMDPAVYEAAKTYWFKSAPGHEGIHGLLTGVFLDDRSQCFVGSACTLEILDTEGALLKRMPVFWGPGRHFAIIDGPNGSKNLLIGRWPNGNDTLAILNNQSLQLSRGFSGVPAGHTFVSGWTAQNRVGIFYGDLAADGTKRVVSTTNGRWNRVTVYDEAGTPVSNAQFGPGPTAAPRSTMRGQVVADLDGDGRKEIVVATAEGLVVALNADCEKKWAKRLDSPPVLLAATPVPDRQHSVLAAASSDGSVWILADSGAILEHGRTEGKPTAMAFAAGPNGPRLLVGTNRGAISAFDVAP